MALVVQADKAFHIVFTPERVRKLPVVMTIRVVRAAQSIQAEEIAVAGVHVIAEFTIDCTLNGFIPAFLTPVSPIAGRNRITVMAVLMIVPKFKGVVFIHFFI